MKFLAFSLFIFHYSLFNICGCGGASVESYGEGSKVLKWIKVSGTRIKGLKASATLLQKSPKGAFRGDAYVFFKAPSSVRIDILGPADNMVGSFVSRKGKGLIVDYMTGAALIASDSSCLFSEFLGIDMVLPRFSAIFMGSPPVIEFDESELTWNPKGYYILGLRDNDAGVDEKMQVVQGKYGTAVIRAVVLKDRKMVVDISFRGRGWKIDELPLMPKVVEAVFVKEKLRMLLKYRKVEVNTNISDDVFDVAIPPEFPLQTVVCE